MGHIATFEPRTFFEFIGVLSFIQTEEGRAINSGGSYLYEYSLTDHLGNSRLSFDQNSATAIKQQDDYYPFGMEISKGTTVSPKNEYLYNKKELQENLGLYDYGARFYDPVIGRFTSIDPKAEKMRRFSPFNYAFNNPIRFIDPDGMVPQGSGPDPVLDKAVKKALELSSNYSLDKNGRLVIKGLQIANFLRKLTSTAALVFTPLETSENDVIPQEQYQNANDDKYDQDSKNDPKFDTEEDDPDKKYLTYIKTKVDDDGNVTVYSGRTSGAATESDQEILTRRDAGHHMKGYGPAVLDKSSPNRFAIRGREQQLIDHFGRAISDGGTAGNRIRGVSKVNPFGRIYHYAATAKFGELNKYTGN